MSPSESQTESPRQESGPAASSALFGLRVVEFAHLVAGPLAGTLLADLGADVVHVEHPNRGDHARKMGPQRDGDGAWWKVAGRNKRLVSIDLGQPEGRKLAAELIKWADVVITNLKVATLEEWGMDYVSVQKLKPKVIYYQATGYGANTSRANEAGFGKAAEAMSGVVYGTGFPDSPPTHVGFQHGDAVTGLMGAFAIMAAVNRMRVDPNFQGEWIDLALFETLFRLNEWLVVLYDQNQLIAERAGNRLPVAPAAVINTHQTADGDWITVTSGTAKAVLNVVDLVGLDRSDYATHNAQLEHAEILDRAIGKWMSQRTTDGCLKGMSEAGAVGSLVFSIKDIVADQTYQEREDIIEVEDPELGPIKMQGVIPKLHIHGGAVWRTGGRLGQDNELVMRDWLGLSQAEVDGLIEHQVI